MMKKAFVFVLLVCLFSSFSSSAQTATNSSRSYFTGRIEKVSLNLGVPPVSTEVWGMTHDADGIPFEIPISFFRFIRRDDVTTTTEYYIANSEATLNEWCNYAHPGDIVRVEGRFWKMTYNIPTYNAVCTRITFENQEIEGTIVLIPKPKVSLPHMSESVPCIRTEAGREFILCEEDDTFVSHDGNEVMIGGKPFLLNTNVKIVGDVSQKYAVGVGEIRFLQICAKTVSQQK